MRSLLALCRLRSTLPAFDGPLTTSLDGTTLTLTRTGHERPDASATAVIDLATGQTQLRWSIGNDQRAVDTLNDLPRQLGPVSGPIS